MMSRQTRLRVFLRCWTELHAGAAVRLGENDCFCLAARWMGLEQGAWKLKDLLAAAQQGNIVGAAEMLGLRPLLPRERKRVGDVGWLPRGRDEVFGVTGCCGIYGGKMQREGGGWAHFWYMLRLETDAGVQPVLEWMLPSRPQVFRRRGGAV